MPGFACISEQPRALRLIYRFGAAPLVDTREIIPGKENAFGVAL